MTCGQGRASLNSGWTDVGAGLVPALNHDPGGHEVRPYNWSRTMTKPSLSYRVTATALAFLFAYAAVIAQDIAGGAGVLLASADVEAKLGRGIFTPAQSKPHVNKAPDKKTLARSVRSAHPRANTAGNRPSNTGNSGNTGNRSGTGARPVMDAE